MVVSIRGTGRYFMFSGKRMENGFAMEMVCDGDDGSLQNYIDLGRSCRYRTIRNIHNQIYKSLASRSTD